MGRVVCATRGGEASRRTQQRAIDLAKERDADLVFMCVVDPEFAEPGDEALQQALRDELMRLGQSLLCIAQARAEEQGVEAETVVRCGPVTENLRSYLEGTHADVLVIGAPAKERTTEVLGPENVDELAESIAGSSDVEVIVVS
jgi:nucleotide-binding universal stress UspA family protein